MDEKRFQLIRWSKNEKLQSVRIWSQVYDDVDSVIKACKGKNIVIAIGLNPSNKTVFNEDETNLYLRDKIYTNFKCEGYLLTNLSAKITSDSETIHNCDIIEDHIKALVKLLKVFRRRKVVVFFGVAGIEKLNSTNLSSMGELKEILLKRRERVYYTEDAQEKFVHPGLRKQNYKLVKIKNDTLDKK